LGILPITEKEISILFVFSRKGQRRILIWQL
jgi:hypothetical protein